MTASNELIRGAVAPVVLALLSEREMYGYEIVKVVNARTDGVLAFKEGTLYPLLHKLEQQRLIKSRWRDAPSGKPRKYYALTGKGAVEAKRRREEWGRVSSAVNTILCGA